MAQTDDSQRRTEPTPSFRGIDTDDVDLADRFMSVYRRVVAVHFGPMEANQLTAAFGEKEAGRIEPWFLLALLDVGKRPAALLRVSFERTVVEFEPGRFVAADFESAHLDTGRQWSVRNRCIERSAQLQ